MRRKIETCVLLGQVILSEGINILKLLHIYLTYNIQSLILIYNR